MYNTILVPIDLAHTDEGKKNLNIALAQSNENSTIVLLYVIEAIPSWTEIDLPINFREDSIQAAEQSLRALAESSDNKIDIKVRVGHAYSTILKVAEAIDADLIVLASHKPGLKDYFIGSNTTKVVGHADCSVLVVR